VAASLLCLVSSLVSAYDWPQFDGTAQHTGNNTQEWSRSHGPGSCHINTSTVVCYTTSSPVIDPNRRYVYTYGLDGYVHQHRVTDGMETVGNGWPELVTTKPSHEKGSSALSIATANNGTSYLYVTHAGYPGDQGDCQGHLTAINLTTGAQHVFDTLCSGQAVHFVTPPGTPDCTETRAAIWARPGVVYDPQTDKIYMATGNGAFDGAQHWGDRVSSPLVAGGILFDAAGSNVIACNPVDSSALWQNPTPLGGFHWESPVVANGVLSIADEASKLTAYALPVTNPLPPPQPQGPSLGSPPALLPNPRKPTGQPAQSGPPAPLPVRRP